jgi:hypothetical protein
MTVEIGGRFTVSAPQTIRNDKGRVLATYRPEFDYTVTPRNVGVVSQLIADGKATAGGRATTRTANRLTPRPVKVRGRAKTGKAKR